MAELAEWLRSQHGVVSTAAIIQNFQGTPHEARLTGEQAEIMQWDEAFDVEAEFEGVLNQLLADKRRQQLQQLNAKMKGLGLGLKGLNEQEQALYVELATQRGTG